MPVSIDGIVQQGRGDRGLVEARSAAISATAIGCVT